MEEICVQLTKEELIEILENLRDNESSRALIDKLQAQLDSYINAKEG